jgi:integrase
MANRANGEGTISQRRKNGKVVGWKGAAVVGYKPDGSEDRRWVSGKTQADVREKLEGIKTARNGGMLSTSGSMTFGEYLDTWLEHIKSTGKAQNTLDDYTYTVQHIKSVLSNKRIDKLTVLDIEKVVKTVGETISSSAARRVLSRTRQTLEQAVRWQLIPRNVAKAVQMPKAPKRSWTSWEALEAAKFLDNARLHRLYALFYLALTTGLRSAELRGLRWQDLDLVGGWLNVTHNALEGKDKRPILSPTTKTDKSARRIRIDAGITHVLLEHQKRQELQQEYIENPRPDLERRRERKGLELVYTEQSLVFCTELGGILGDRNLRRDFTQLAEVAGVPKIRIHDMRHTAASAMIRRGYPAKLVADILGHTDPGFTLRTYAHIWGEQREEFALSAANLYGFDGPATALN